MDFFSVAISAGSLAVVLFKAVESLGLFTAEALTVPDTIADFHRSIRNLHRALQCVARTFEQAGREENEADRKAHPDVFQTLRECRLALDRLQRQLPELSEGPRAIERARASLEMRLRRPVIQGLVASIDSYTQILQLTITSLSYGTALDIQQEIVSLRRDMRQASFASLPQYSELDVPAMPPLTAKGDKDPTWPLQEANLSALSLHTSRSMGRSPSSTTVNLLDDGSDDEDDDFDPERRENLPSRSFLESALEENLELSNQMSLEGIFNLAASYQKKAIAHREQLARVRHETFPFEEECAMKERLVELLLGSEARVNVSEAEVILQTLLTQEVQQDPGDDERYRRLNHKLGYLCLNLNKLRQAQRFLERAVQGRPGTAPPPVELVVDSLSLLIETLYCKKDYGEARAYARLMPASQVMPEEDDQPPPLRATTATTHAWCKEKGFDVGADDFYFHSFQYIGGKDITPIQSAIEAGAVDILREMLTCRPILEIGDEQEAQRPLQMAALKRDAEMVELLLDHKAQGEVLDKFGRTILHCCQHKHGGVEVTEVVARRLPSIINVKAKNGRTALFQAVQMENEESARALLVAGADPNIGLELGGYIMSTPMIWVIESKIQTQRKINMVKMLLEGGADREGRSSDGKTPWKATERSGLAKVPIRKLLNSAPASSSGPQVRIHPPPSPLSVDSGSSSGKSTKKWSFIGRAK